MNWKRVSSYCIESGAYKIAKFSLGGRELYELHAGDELIGHYPNGNAARKAANKHSEGKR